MFKLVVLFSAVCAMAAGKPSGALFAAPLAAPLAYTSTFYSPATTLTKTSAVLHAAPIYQSPTFISGAHFIKKRSAIAPLAYSPAIIVPTYSSQAHVGFPAKTIYTAAAPVISNGFYSAPLTYAHI